MEKFLRILLCASAALLSLVACDQEQIGEMASPNDSDNKEIHFVQKSLVKEFEQGTKEGEFTVVLARNGNKGTYRVLPPEERQERVPVSLYVTRWSFLTGSTASRSL